MINVPVACNVFYVMGLCRFYELHSSSAMKIVPSSVLSENNYVGNFHYL